MGTDLGTIVAHVRSGEISAVDAVSAVLATIRDTNPTLNAFVVVDEERAMSDAADVDRRVAAGDVGLALAGVPLAVKDTEHAAGYPTTFGSRLWADGPVASHDSVLVARLRAAGCVVVGKTNTPELAAKGTTDNPLFGATGNPHDPARTAGGSSGGSAAAVASRMIPLATASDGGGSIRIPASACGIPGFKPSLGRIPDGGPTPVDWQNLTSRGVLTRTVDELLMVLDVVVGAEPTDLRSLPTPPIAWSIAVARQRMPARVGWSPTLGYAQNDPQIERTCLRAVERLAAAGVEIVELPTVFERDPIWPWVTLVASYLRRSVGDGDQNLMDPSVRAYLTIADTLTAQQLIDAEDECHRLNLALVHTFQSCDLLLTPTLAQSPPLILAADGPGDDRPGDDRPGNDDPGDEAFVRSTYPFNLTRSPAGTIPVGFDANGLPVGLQIVGPQHGDVAVLHLMRHLELSDWPTDVPPLRSPVPAG